MSSKIKTLNFVIAALFGATLATSALAQVKDTNATAKETKATTVKSDPKTGANAPIKIGFVNTDRILRESEPAKQAQAKIESEFKKRDADLQKMAQNLRKKYEDFDKNSPVMSDADRAKAQRELGDLDTDLQRKRREFQEDFNRRRNEAFAVIVDKANTAIRQIAEAEGYDLIVQDAVTVSDRIDITDKVMKALGGTPAKK